MSTFFLIWVGRAAVARSMKLKEKRRWRDEGMGGIKKLICSLSLTLIDVAYDVSACSGAGLLSLLYASLVKVTAGRIAFFVSYCYVFSMAVCLFCL